MQASKSQINGSQIQESQVRYVQITDFTRLKILVAEGLWSVVRYAGGSRVSFRPKTLLKRVINGNVEITPATLTIVKHILDKLKERGLIGRYDYLSVPQYYVDKTSPLWQLAKESEDSSKILQVIESIEEGEENA